MSVHNNLCTPKNGEILVAATQDFLSVLHPPARSLLDRARLLALIAYMGDALMAVDLPTPAIIKPVEFGRETAVRRFDPPQGCRQGFRQLQVAGEELQQKGHEAHVPAGRLRVHQKLGDHVRAARQGDAGQRHQERPVLRPQQRVRQREDGVVHEQGGEAPGGGSAPAASSVGIDDVTPGHRLQDEKGKVVDRGYDACDERIEAFKRGTLALQPGCNAEQTLEAEVLGILSTVRETAGNVCLDEPRATTLRSSWRSAAARDPPSTSRRWWRASGSKPWGVVRPPGEFAERSLPHFRRGEKTPAAKGFVANPLLQRDATHRVLLHTMAGRGASSTPR